MKMTKIWERVTKEIIPVFQYDSFRFQLVYINRRIKGPLK